MINKAEAEEQAKLAQNKLCKGVNHKASVEIAAVEVTKKLGDKARCKFCGRTGYGKNRDTKARKKLCPAVGNNCFK